MTLTVVLVLQPVRSGPMASALNRLPMTKQEPGRSRPVPSPSSGGLIESALSPGVRPVLDRQALESFLPAARGPFQFPPPYNTTGYRLTVPDDCGGRDCVDSVGYSYWRNMNNSRDSNTLLAFITLNRDKGGGGPTLFEINKDTGAVSNRGPIFGSGDPRSGATAEGWYFSATMPTTLYIPETTRLTRYDVKTHATETVFDLNDTQLFGRRRGIWQVQSSNDDRVHSFSVTDLSNDARIGCGVYQEATRNFLFFPRIRDDFDECQVDKSGRWLLIKEQVDGRNGEDNRIIDLSTGSETRLLDEDGAGGHSDMGYGAMVAADNWFPPAAAWRLWEFGTVPLGPKTIVYRDINWDLTTIEHVSWANATPDNPTSQFACGSGVFRHPGPRAGEIVCFQLNGSLRTVPVAPVMTDLAAAGGGDEYWKLPKGNLDVTGQYFMWSSNMDGNRLDAFIVRIPVDTIVRRHAVPRP